MGTEKAGCAKAVLAILVYTARVGAVGRPGQEVKLQGHTNPDLILPSRPTPKDSTVFKIAFQTRQQVIT